MKFTKLKVIPMPKEVYGVDDDGNFAIAKIQPKIWINCDKCKMYAASFMEYVYRIHGIEFEEGQGGIEFYRDLGIVRGGYRIECEADSVKVYTYDADGVTNAMATLLQLLCKDGDDVTLPLVKIVDRPDCEYRSLFVDLARQWHPFETLFEYVDLAYLYKMKFLQLHFVDTQSYTLPIAAFPELPTKDRHYTKEQIAELVEYAHARNVELVPEMEFPGHSQAMILARPDLFAIDIANDDEVRPGVVKPAFNNNVISVGKPGILDTIQTLLNELKEMFPYSRYFHLGGDEAELAQWNYCRHCIKYMKEHNIPDERALYTHFVKLVTDMVLEMGITPIVWEGFPKDGSEDISKDVLVVAWETEYQLPSELIEEGFSILNSAWRPCYIVPTRQPSVEELLAWNVYTWTNYAPRLEATLNPIHLQPTKQLKGAIMCAWEWNYDEEIPYFRRNIAPFSERVWNIKRVATDEQFLEKLEYTQQMAEALACK